MWLAVALSFPRPSVSGCESVVDILWDSSILWLDDCESQFCLWRDPLASFGLPLFLLTDFTLPWLNLPLSSPHLEKIWRAHFSSVFLSPLLSSTLLLLSRRLLCVSPEVNALTVDASLQAMASSMAQEVASDASDDAQYRHHLEHTPPSPVDEADSPWTKGFKRYLYEMVSCLHM